MIIGIDEVGRGCWAGPLVAAAVGLTDSHGIVGLNDSKKLSMKKRQLLAGQIRKTTSYLGVGWVWPDEINYLGLTQSVQLAMQRAIDKIEIEQCKVIIDGNINYLLHIPTSQAVIKADSCIPAVSAASIIAKVERDKYMSQIAVQYPDYGFDQHVGYGTKLHVEALSKYGITPIHRVNYKPLKKYAGSYDGN